MLNHRRVVSFYALVVLATLFVSAACLDLTSGCGSELLNELWSPDGKLKAAVFQRDCGATTGFSTQVYILRASDELQNENGNIFVADTDHGKAPSGQGGGPELEVRWTSARKLQIKHDRRARLFLAEQSLNDVIIQYEIFAQ